MKDVKVLYQIKSLEKAIMRFFIRDLDVKKLDNCCSIPPTQMQIIGYILENKEDINNTSDLRFILTNFYSEYLFLILVFGVMIAGAIVSEEYSKGTIKSLLITPYKRSKILLSKFITVILLTI